MTTLLQAILESAKRSGAAFDSSCTADGTLGSLVDSALPDQAGDQTSYNGGWIYRPNAALSTDKVRRIAENGFNPQSGALIPLRQWTNAPTNGETYHVYAMVPPIEQPGTIESWRRLVNRARGNMWFIDELTVGHGLDGFYDRTFPVDRMEIVYVAAIAVAGGTGITITPPVGWTSRLTLNLSTTLQLQVFTKRQLNNDPIEWNFAFGQSVAASAILGAYVDCNPTSPVDATSNSGTLIGPATTLTIPAVNTAQNNEVALRFIASATPAVFTPPTNVFARADVVELDGSATIGLALYDNTVTVAGTASAAALAMTASSSVNMLSAGVSLNIRSPRKQTVFTSYSYAQNGSGATSITLLRPVDVPNTEWVPNRQSVRQYLFRRYPAGYNSDYRGQPVDVDMNKGGRWADMLENGTIRSLQMSQGPSQQQDVVLVCQRPYPPLTLDNDSIEDSLPLDVLALRTRVELFAYMNSAPQTRGDYSTELAAAISEWSDRWKQIAPATALIGAG